MFRKFGKCPFLYVICGIFQIFVIAARRRRDLRQAETEGPSGPQARVTVTAADTLWLEWTRVEQAEFYSLLIREQSSSSKPVVMTVYGEAAIISELKPATTYCVALSARNSRGSGPYSNPVCTRTAALR